MAWKFQKKQIDLEKAIGADTTSSFGSVKHNVIIVPPKAYHGSGNSSPTEAKFEQSGNSSPQFTSSFPTQEEREQKMRTFVRRHAFIILVTVIFMLVLCITAVLVLVRMRNNSRNFNPLTDQLTQTAGVTAAAQPTSSI